MAFFLCIIYSNIFLKAFGEIETVYLVDHKFFSKHNKNGPFLHNNNFFPLGFYIKYMAPKTRISNKSLSRDEICFVI